MTKYRIEEELYDDGVMFWVQVDRSGSGRWFTLGGRRTLEEARECLSKVKDTPKAKHIRYYADE